jgi:hypothetical protein
MSLNVPIHCTAAFPNGRPCHQPRFEHVHHPTPCRNGVDEQHHDFAPPKTVSVVIEGRIRRLKVSA